MFVERGLKQELYLSLLRLNYSPLVASVLARRCSTLKQSETLCDLRLSKLHHSGLLPDISKGVNRIVQAMHCKEAIGIQSDFDTDGLTAHATLILGMTECLGYEKNLLHSFVGQRLSAPRGLNQEVVQSICDSGIKVLITADGGSTELDALQKLRRSGIDVIITDHHWVSKPASDVYAFINPNYDNSSFPDKHIAGCTIAWLLIYAIYIETVETILSDSLLSLLSFVSVATIGDQVSLGLSINNRIVVKYGLKIINQSQRDCWQTLRNYLKSPITPDSIRFYIAPLLNAASRVGEVSVALSFLLSDSLAQAEQHLMMLISYNNKRKIQQSNLLNLVKKKLSVADVDIKNPWLSLYLPTSNPGINGIIASELASNHRKIVAVFSPAPHQQELIVGSIRGNPQSKLSIIKMLGELQQANSKLILRYGGHDKAAGLSLNRSMLPLFNAAVMDFLSSPAQTSKEIEYAVLHDGFLDEHQIADVDNCKQLLILEPFGMDWEEPLFCSVMRLLTVIHYKNNVARMFMSVGTISVKAIAFKTHTLPSINIGCMYEVMYHLRADRLDSLSTVLHIKCMRELN